MQHQHLGYKPADRKTMQRRLHELTGRWLLTDEANELQLLADTLGVGLNWRRYTFQNDKVVGLGDRRPEGAMHHGKQ
jgi:hypothetical protein